MKERIETEKQDRDRKGDRHRGHKERLNQTQRQTLLIERERESVRESNVERETSLILTVKFRPIVYSM